MEPKKDISQRPAPPNRTLTADDILIQYPALLRRTREASATKHASPIPRRADIELSHRLLSLKPIFPSRSPVATRPRKKVHFDERGPVIIDASFATRHLDHIDIPEVDITNPHSYKYPPDASFDCSSMLVPMLNRSQEMRELVEHNPEIFRLLFNSLGLADDNRNNVERAREEFYEILFAERDAVPDDVWVMALKELILGSGVPPCIWCKVCDVIGFHDVSCSEASSDVSLENWKRGKSDDGRWIDEGQTGSILDMSPTKCHSKVDPSKDVNTMEQQVLCLWRTRPNIFRELPHTCDSFFDELYRLFQQLEMAEEHQVHPHVSENADDTDDETHRRKSIESEQTSAVFDTNIDSLPPRPIPYEYRVFMKTLEQTQDDMDGEAWLNLLKSILDPIPSMWQQFLLTVLSAS